VITEGIKAHARTHEEGSKLNCVKSHNCFTFRTTNGKRWRFTRLPMGYKSSVDIMQHILLAIKMEVMERLKASGLSARVLITDVYVDNILFAADDKEVLEFIWHQIRLIAADAGITIGDQGLGLEVEYRGVRISQTHFSLKESFVQKIQIHMRAILARGKVKRPLFETVVGEVTYADALLMVDPIRRLLHVYGQWTNALQQGIHLLRLSEATRHELEHVLQWIGTRSPLNLWATPVTGETVTMVFSDASSTRLGFVRCEITPTTVTTKMGSHIHHHDRNREINISGHMNPADYPSRNCIEPLHRPLPPLDLHPITKYLRDSAVSGRRRSDPVSATNPNGDVNTANMFGRG
jgi:hypothetical protein